MAAGRAQQARQARVLREMQAWLMPGGGNVPAFRNVTELTAWWTANRQRYDQYVCASICDSPRNPNLQPLGICGNITELTLRRAETGRHDGEISRAEMAAGSREPPLDHGQSKMLAGCSRSWLMGATLADIERTHR